MVRREVRGLCWSVERVGQLLNRCDVLILVVPHRGQCCSRWRYSLWCVNCQVNEVDVLSERAKQS